MGVVATHDERDDEGRLVRSITMVSGQVVLEQHYTYDVLSRVATVTTSRGGASAVPQQVAYAYDAGRLARVGTDGVEGERYTYDTAGQPRVGHHSFWHRGCHVRRPGSGCCRGVTRPSDMRLSARCWRGRGLRASRNSSTTTLVRCAR